MNSSLTNTSECIRDVAIGFVIIMILAFSTFAFAQNRVDLDDLNIKGELLNDNRLRLSARDPHRITDRVSYRTNFRKEITDGLEINWPETTGGNRGTASDSSDNGKAADAATDSASGGN
jgi:hypothetical protein